MLKERLIKTSIILILGVLVFIFFFLPFVSRFIPKEHITLRVRLIQNAKAVLISSEGRCRITDASSGVILEANTDISGGLKLALDPGGIALNSSVFPVESIRITSPRDKGISVNGALYGGEIDIARGGEGLDIINRIELEEYLKGVLPKEVSYLWPMSTLKAQAIASRSFAVVEMLRRKSKSYDLTADTFSQVYGGRSAQRWRTTRAVDATKGKVLEYEGKVLQANFHACCGGHTEDAALLWGYAPAPLKGVKSPWCRWTPHFRWRVKTPTKDIITKLNERGYYFDRIDDIKTGPRDDSNRVEYVRIRSGNKWFEISAKDFMTAIGRKTLRSANFRVKKYPLFYLFSGYGWGHGVGMCQWGAFTMGLRWQSDKRILEHFYPGAKIVTLKEVLN